MFYYDIQCMINDIADFSRCFKIPVRLEIVENKVFRIYSESLNYSWDISLMNLWSSLKYTDIKRKKLYSRLMDPSDNDARNAFIQAVNQVANKQR